MTKYYNTIRIDLKSFEFLHFYKQVHSDESIYRTHFRLPAFFIIFKKSNLPLVIS